MSASTFAKRAEDADKKIEALEHKLAQIRRVLGTDVPQTGDEESDAKSEMSTDFILSLLKDDNGELWKQLRPILGDNKNLNVTECGDGNINYIFIVTNADDTSKSVVVKQAPPFIRLVGPVWPLKQGRAEYECDYSRRLEANCQPNDKWMPHNPAPKIFTHDAKLHLFVMENLQPMKVYRGEIGAGVMYPNVGKHVGCMLGQMLFKTSDLYLSAAEKWKLVGQYSANDEMSAITEQVIFEEPYFEADNNRTKIVNNEKLKSHCSAMIDTVTRLRSDPKVIKQVYRLRQLFRNSHQSLLHGDLHTGSLMLSKDRSVAFDAEFAMVGPMAFDIGLMIGNMILGYFAQTLFETQSGQRDTYRAYLLEQTADIWNVFQSQFLQLWDTANNGNLFPKTMASDAMLAEYKKEYLGEVLKDSMHFAAAVMIRRCLGIADAAEYRVADEKARVNAEQRVVALAHQMMVSSFQSIEEVIDLIKKQKH